MASAKQKAASRRNVKKAQAARRRNNRKAPKRKRSSTPRTKRKSMAKNKGGFRKAKSGISGFIKSGTVGKIVQGVGAGSLAVLVLNRVAPQFAPIGGVAAGFLGGGLIGGAINLFLQGGLSNFGNIFGGGANGGGGEAV